MLGFSVLIVIDLFGKQNEEDDDHESICYDQDEESQSQTLSAIEETQQEVSITERSMDSRVKSNCKITERSLPNSKQEGLTVEDDSFNY